MGADKELQEAEARLLQLLEQGLIGGIGTVQTDQGPKFLIGIDAQTDPRAGDYDARNVSVIRDRLKDALQDIPFSILGDYSEEPQPASNNNSRAKAHTLPFQEPTSYTTTGSASANSDPPLSSRMQHASMPESGTSITDKKLADFERKIDNAIDGIRTDLMVIFGKIDSAKEQIARLDRKTQELPSTGLVITVAVVIVALLVPSILFQGRGPDLLLRLQSLLGMR